MFRTNNKCEKKKIGAKMRDSKQIVKMKKKKETELTSNGKKSDGIKEKYITANNKWQKQSKYELCAYCLPTAMYNTILSVYYLFIALTRSLFQYVFHK